MQKQQLLYKGKAKSVYETEDHDLLILHFRDDTSALDGKRIEQLARTSPRFRGRSSINAAYL